MIVSFTKFIFVRGSTIYVWVYMECSLKDTSPVEGGSGRGLGSVVHKLKVFGVVWSSSSSSLHCRFCHPFVCC